MVSILVFLDLGLWRASGSVQCGSVEVSILVFLDLGLWLVRDGHPVRPVSQFQSLFFWIWGSGSSCQPNMLFSVWTFQSLFFWIWGSGFFSVAMASIPCQRFQSLFFWIWGSGPAGCPLSRIPPRPVSILVFLDLGLWLVPHPRSSPWAFGDLSYVSWRG